MAEAREEKQERWGHNRCLRRDCRKDLYIDKHVVLEEEEEEEEEEKHHRRRRRRYKDSNLSRIHISEHTRLGLI